MTRPTLHDELMREAGFADRHRELEERQTRRRRRIIVLIHFAATAAISALLLAVGMPHPLGLGGIPWLIVPVVVFWVMRRVLDHLGWHEEGPRL
jgi:fatty acid desaturase